MKENKRRKLTFENIMREIFELVGIEFKTFEFARWRELEGYENLDPIIIKDFADGPTELVDGRYTLTIDNVKISDIENKPFLISEISIVALFENSVWLDLNIYPDFEEYELEPDQNATQYLDGRLQRIKERIRAALEFLSMILRIKLK